jgi:tRNA pseudouridine38-40 synthase
MPKWRSSSSSDLPLNTPVPTAPAGSLRASDPVPQAPTPSLRRIALCIQYDGAAFHGWQRQTSLASVQQILEGAIEALDPHRPVQAVAAGRTDTGVHAAGQVVHFDSAGPIPAQRWARALNGRLPASVRVRAASEVPPDWHACFYATYRRYRYTIYNARTPNLFLAPWSWHRYQLQLAEGLMAEVLADLIGEHDFSAFQRAGSRRSHARTTIQAVEVRREGDLVVTELQASGFLYGMVRLVMGQLVAVGEGRLHPDAFRDRWRRRQRHAVKEAAPPHGLCLLRVGYPDNPFPQPAWYDGQPQFRLGFSDPPQSWHPLSLELGCQG